LYYFNYLIEINFLFCFGIVNNSWQSECRYNKPVLILICADAETQHTEKMATKISSNLLSQYACAFVRSNL